MHKKQAFCILEGASFWHILLTLGHITSFHISYMGPPPHMFRVRVPRVQDYYYSVVVRTYQNGVNQDQENVVVALVVKRWCNQSNVVENEIPRKDLTIGSEGRKWALTLLVYNKIQHFLFQRRTPNVWSDLRMHCSFVSYVFD